MSQTETPGRSVEIARLQFKATEFPDDDKGEWADTLLPFAEKLMQRTDSMPLLREKARDDISAWASELAKGAKAMAETATERAKATLHGGENLFAKLVLACCAYHMEFKAWPHPGVAWTVQGSTFHSKPEDWNSIRRWVEMVFVLSGVK